MKTPQLSVVIPTCGRIASLSALLERLRPECQGMPAQGFEVIVSDDSRTTPAAELLQERFPAVRFLTGPGRGPAANRNHGARHARAAWLVFVDDDCQPADRWLQTIASETAAGSVGVDLDVNIDVDVDVIEGKIVAVNNQDSIFKRHVENLQGDCFWTANLAIRRDVFERLGGFDEDFPEAGGEDLEFAHRIRASRARTRFAEAAVVYHPSHVMTWRGVLTLPFGIRWHLLYRLKTQTTLPATTPLWRVVPQLAATETVTLVRTTVRALRSRAGHRTVPALSRTLLNWLMFPVVLPYMVYWDVRFRRQIRSVN